MDVATDRRCLCLVINMDGSTERWRTISSQLDQIHLSNKRLSAVDGRGATASTQPDYDADQAMRYMGREMVGGEIGCYLSHLKAARAFLEDGASHALILEDDARPDPRLGQIVEDTTAFLDRHDPDWRIVNLGNHKLKIAVPVHIVETETTAYVLHEAFYFPMTTGAILWSRKGAEEFVAGHDKIFAPVDNYLRHWITRAGGGYAFSPRPVGTIEAESEIDTTKRSQNKRSLLYGPRKQRRLLVDKAIAMQRKLRRGQTMARAHD